MAHDPSRMADTVRILVLHGPNLNMLGRRQIEIYGTTTLDEINRRLAARAIELGCELAIYQANGEGQLIDRLHEEAGRCEGILINPGGLTHNGYGLRDALVIPGVPIVEVHLSNIYAREAWRHHSVIAPIALGQVSGFGWRSYLAGLELLFAALRERSP